MTRACSGCGLYLCAGECYGDPIEETPCFKEDPAREPYVPSPEYLAWCAEVDARQIVDAEIKQTGPNRWRSEAA